jgi:hypothetical protein
MGPYIMGEVEMGRINCASCHCLAFLIQYLTCGTMASGGLSLGLDQEARYGAGWYLVSVTRGCD